VVTTDVPGCRKTVTDLINGRLASRRECIYAPDAMASMGAASGERILARFSAARVNPLWLALLRECLT
jgi:hypothetical protein